MSPRPEHYLKGQDQFAWLEYERHLMVRNRSPRTIQSYGEAAVQLAQHIAPVPLLEADRARIEEYLITCREAHSTGTQACRWRSLRAFYAWLADEEIIDRSPMRRIERPAGWQKIPAVLSGPEIAALRRECEGKTFTSRRDAAALELWLSPGSPRLAEIAGLTTGDVALGREATVLLHGKGSKDRLIPPTDTAVAALLRYLRARASHKLASAGTDALWLGERRGFGARGLAQMLSMRARAAGLGHVHPHQLRHTAWHNWRTAGGDIDHGMILWGWSQVEMALMYGRSAAVARALQAGRELGRAS